MKIDELNNVVSLANIGLVDKEELQNTIDEALKTIEALKMSKDNVAGIKETADDVNSIYKEYEASIEVLQQALADYKNFNKHRCLENIRFLLKEKTDIKIGQIEKEASVSPGYMSRLEKDGNTSEPSMEFIVSAAKLLKISIDSLISVDFTGLTPTEQYLVNFFDKLKDDTLKDRLDWNIETASSLNRMESDMNGYVDHPLFNYESVLFKVFSWLLSRRVRLQ